MNSIQWGILGTGNIARKLASELTKTDEAKLQAVASRSLDKAKDFAADFEVKNTYGCYEELLQDPEVEVVYIATPHPEHAYWIEQASDAGKHVLCEKPLTLNYAQAMRAIEKARLNKVFLMEAFMYRCHPQTGRLKEIVLSGEIGEIRHINVSFSFGSDVDRSSRLVASHLGGGGILDVGCYTLSMCRLIAGWLTGKAYAEPLEFKSTGVLDEIEGTDLWTSAVAKFSEKLSANLFCGVALTAGSQVEIFGSQGHIKVTSPWFCDGAIKIHRHPSGVTEEIGWKEGELKSLYVYEIEEVCRCLREGHKESPAMGHADTLGNLKLLDQWRAEIGAIYPSETESSGCPCITGRALERNDNTPMSYGQLPGLNKKISQLVLGCMTQGNLPEACVQFDDFYEKGGNCFDTALIYRGYGHVPSFVGQWANIRGVREEVVIIDKGAHHPYCYPDVIEDEIHRALSDHRTDYIDIYMMHRDNPAVPVGEFMDAIHQMLEKGMAKTYGLSNWNQERLEEAIQYARNHGLREPVCLSNNLSLAHMVESVWPDCISASNPRFRDWLIQRQYPLFAWSSQARGFFTDRSAPDKKEDPELVRCWYSDDNFLRNERAVRLAEKHGVSTLNIALAYVLQQPYPVYALIGPSNLQEMRTLLPALEISLSDEERQWLNLEID